MKSLPKVSIGVFGGSGFYSFFDKSETVKISTPYGSPSAEITIAEIAGKKVAFLPRHGLKHQFPAHKVPYKANLYAFKELGVERIISPCTVGSLQTNIKPGDFVVLDQFFDRTKGREDTFFDGPETVHVSAANPYCPELRKVSLAACRKLEIPVHQKGTVVVINGPRFSTSAESLFFTNQGFDVINMTQYPECMLAREMEMCFTGIALVTDWDAGLSAKGKVKPVEFKEIIEIFNKNLDKSRKLVLEIIKNIRDKRDCTCEKALEGARITA